MIDLRTYEYKTRYTKEYAEELLAEHDWDLFYQHEQNGTLQEILELFREDRPIEEIVKQTFEDAQKGLMDFFNKPNFETRTLSDQTTVSLETCKKVVGMLPRLTMLESVLAAEDVFSKTLKTKLLKAKYLKEHKEKNIRDSSFSNALAFQLTQTTHIYVETAFKQQMAPPIAYDRIYRFVDAQLTECGLHDEQVLNEKDGITIIQDFWPELVKRIKNHVLPNIKRDISTGKALN